MKKQRELVRFSITTLALSLMSSVALVPGAIRLASAQTVAPSWTLTGNLRTVRWGHTATLLNNGTVLVVAGANANGSTSTAELYDPATGTWTGAGNLNGARLDHTATLLQNGKVLIAGGYVSIAGSYAALSSAELYDPTTGTWTSTGNLTTGRSAHTATLLPNGKVLVAGGYSGNSVELYDPAKGTWISTGSLQTARGDHTATLLHDGKVLVSGGGNDGRNALNSAELYDQATGEWSITGNLNTARVDHTATLLSNGKVLVAGGYNSVSGGDSLSAELYDPGTGMWTSTGNLNFACSGHTATLLQNGKVMVTGGIDWWDDRPLPSTNAELYDAATGMWNSTAYLNTPRFNHTATLLPNGKVLVAGSNLTTELYDPGSMTANPIDDPRFFVRWHYFDFLNREPDPAGVDFWTNNITSCGIDSSCLEAKRIDTSAAFFLSIEFQQTGYLVYRVFKTSYGNIPGTPVPVRRDEFLPDTQQIGQGVVVNQPGWEQALESNKQAFMFEFVQRSRFTSALPTSMTPTEFVDKLYLNAGVAPSVTDRTAAINEFGLATNTADTAARGRALRRVAENGTLARQEFNKAFVLMQYFGYLQRNPNDPPELTLDFQGYNFWLNKLDSFNGDYNRAEMVKSFLVSGEYRQRFGQ